MFKKNMSYSELVSAFTATSQRGTPLNIEQSRLILNSLTDPFLFKMLQFYGGFRVPEDIVNQAHRRFFSDGSCAYGISDPLLDHQDTLLRLESLIKKHIKKADIQSSLQSAEQSRYQKRLRKFDQGELNFLEKIQSIEDIMKDFDDYFQYLKNKNHHDSFGVHWEWTLLKDLLDRIDFVKKDLIKKRLINLCIGFIDACRAFQHASADKAIQGKNYAPQERFKKFLKNFFQKHIITNKDFLYPIERVIVDLHDPFMDALPNTDLRSTIARPSIGFYKLYLDAAGYSIEENKFALDTEPVRELIPPIRMKTEEEIMKELLQIGPFIDRAHLKNALALHDKEASLKSLQALAATGVVVSPPCLPTRDYFINLYDHYVKTFKPNFYPFFHGQLALNPLINITCTDDALCTCLERHFYTSKQYEDCAVLCIQKGYINALSDLLGRCHVNPNLCDSYNNISLVERAIDTGNSEILDVLIEKGANLNCVNRLGETPLIVFSKKGNLKAVQLLLKYSIDLEAKDLYGRTALLAAAERGYYDLIKPLQEAGANLETTQDFFVWEDEASRLRFIEQAHYAFSIGLIPYLVHDSHSPLMVAAFQGHQKTVEVLIQLGAVLDKKDKNGKTALLLAAQQGHKTVVDMLIEAGASADLSDYAQSLSQSSLTRDMPLPWSFLEADFSMLQAPVSLPERSLPPQDTAGINTIAISQHSYPILPRVSLLPQTQISDSCPVHLSELIGSRARLFSETDMQQETAQKTKMSKKK